MLSQTQKKNYKIHLIEVLNTHSSEKVNTKFEISIDTFKIVDGWRYEEEFGMIFDSLYEEYLNEK
jgi:hypothetical protein